ncbi:farnesyl-diphosphate synthase [Candidatus Rickettsiella viridis]|uniref:Farnesyl-diphosphate synthase n=1 Tax=Candidatus Rickettsiella viridis TaxID=676208 RepID=A0A2Z5V7X1_9COXI|nr:polyprenyl synthetase family protein [Candidatus Rickettsiella viridis]BBB15827.1 farnesyl-diphosphate synthase [Candidatus Rickettsiella viridis]
MTTKEALEKYQQRINRFLAEYLSSSVLSEPLCEAMRYSVLNGGKRLRPLLVYLLGEALGLPPEKLDQSACAVELIHAYSLIHDDLPMMDNDDWRRGKPSCHKVFGEAIALLAGDALQTLAFEVLLKAPLPPSKILTMISVLARAAGPSGMVGGQAMEFSGLARPLHREKLEVIYRLKTGALFSVSLELAGIVADVSSDALAVLMHVGQAIGLGYQLQDDISDNAVETQSLIASKNGFQDYLFASLENLQQVLPCFPNEQFTCRLSHLFSEQLLGKSPSLK